MAELIKEMAGIDQDIDLGDKVTTREFMAALGLGSMQATRARLRPLAMCDPPVLLPVRAPRKSMAGVLTNVPAYAVSPTVSWEDVLRILKEA
jgi:hypothetical protein